MRLPYCGPPSQIAEMERDLAAQREATRNRLAQTAILTTEIPLRYPQDLWDAMIEGSVVLEGRVGADGLPTDVKSVAPVHPGLAKAAIETVSQWRFEPARLRDKPVESPLRMTINFRLHF